MFASVFTGCAAEKEFFSGLAQKSGQELLTGREEAQTESIYENSESEAARANTEEENRQPDLRYAYQTLPQNERDVYNEIYDAITSYEKDIVVSTLDKEILDCSGSVGIPIHSIQEEKSWCVSGSLRNIRWSSRKRKHCRNR